MGIREGGNSDSSLRWSVTVTLLALEIESEDLSQPKSAAALTVLAFK